MHLTQGTRPSDLEAVSYDRTVPDLEGVHIGDYVLSMDDFLAVAVYVLCNTDLAPNDLRMEFVEMVKHLEQVPGHNVQRNPAARRLAPS